MDAWILENGAAMHTSDGMEISAAVAAGKTTWVDLDAHSPEADVLLAEGLKLHPLTIEDIWSDRPGPKVDPFPQYVYVCAHADRPPGNGPRDMRARSRHRQDVRRYPRQQPRHDQDATRRARAQPSSAHPRAGVDCARRARPSSSRRFPARHRRLRRRRRVARRRRAREGRYARGALGARAYPRPDEQSLQALR